MIFCDIRLLNLSDLPLVLLSGVVPWSRPADSYPISGSATQSSQRAEWKLTHRATVGTVCAPGRARIQSLDSLGPEGPASRDWSQAPDWLWPCRARPPPVEGAGTRRRLGACAVPGSHRPPGAVELGDKQAVPRAEGEGALAPRGLVAPPDSFTCIWSGRVVPTAGLSLLSCERVK